MALIGFSFLSLIKCLREVVSCIVIEWRPLHCVLQQYVLVVHIYEKPWTWIKIPLHALYFDLVYNWRIFTWLWQWEKSLGFEVLICMTIWFSIWQSMLVFFNPVKFGITFSFGNLLSLGRFVLRFLYCMFHVLLIVSYSNIILVIATVIIIVVGAILYFCLRFLIYAYLLGLK